MKEIINDLYEIITDKEFPEMIKTLPKTEFIIKGLKLLSMLDCEKPTISVLDNCLTFTWYSKNWGEYKLGEYNNRKLVSVCFLTNEIYKKFLGFSYKEIGEDLILLQAIGPGQNDIKTTKDINEAYEFLNDALISLK